MHFFFLSWPLSLCFWWWFAGVQGAGSGGGAAAPAAHAHHARARRHRHAQQEPGTVRLFACLLLVVVSTFFIFSIFPGEVDGCCWHECRIRSSCCSCCFPFLRFLLHIRFSIRLFISRQYISVRLPVRAVGWRVKCGAAPRRSTLWITWCFRSGPPLSSSSQSSNRCSKTS